MLASEEKRTTKMALEKQRGGVEREKERRRERERWRERRLGERERRREKRAPWKSSNIYQLSHSIEDVIS